MPIWVHAATPNSLTCSNKPQLVSRDAKPDIWEFSHATLGAGGWSLLTCSRHHMFYSCKYAMEFALSGVGWYLHYSCSSDLMIQRVW